MKDFLDKWEFTIDMSVFSVMMLAVWALVVVTFFKVAPFTVIACTIMILIVVAYTVADCVRMDKEIVELREKVFGPKDEEQIDNV